MMEGFIARRGGRFFSARYVRVFLARMKREKSERALKFQFSSPFSQKRTENSKFGFRIVLEMAWDEASIASKVLFEAQALDFSRRREFWGEL